MTPLSPEELARLRAVAAVAADAALLQIDPSDLARLIAAIDALTAEREELEVKWQATRQDYFACMADAGCESIMEMAAKAKRAEAAESEAKRLREANAALRELAGRVTVYLVEEAEHLVELRIGGEWMGHYLGATPQATAILKYDATQLLLEVREPQDER